MQGLSYRSGVNRRSRVGRASSSQRLTSRAPARPSEAPARSKQATFSTFFSQPPAPMRAEPPAGTGIWNTSTPAPLPGTGRGACQVSAPASSRTTTSAPCPAGGVTSSWTKGSPASPSSGVGTGRMLRGVNSTVRTSAQEAASAASSAPNPGQPAGRVAPSPRAAPAPTGRSSTSPLMPGAEMRRPSPSVTTGELASRSLVLPTGELASRSHVLPTSWTMRPPEVPRASCSGARYVSAAQFLHQNMIICHHPCGVSPPDVQPSGPGPDSRAGRLTSRRGSVPSGPGCAHAARRRGSGATRGPRCRRTSRRRRREPRGTHGCAAGIRSARSGP